MAPDDRRAIEHKIVEAYYAELTSGKYENGPKDSEFTYEICWNQYIHGGAERWIWLLVFLATICPDNMNQYFHDQLLAFINDHGITEENIGMPRV